MKINTIKQAEEFLYKQIPKTNMRKFPGVRGLERIKAFLKLIGDPQEKIKVIHVAGTSGKGSTSYLISCLLTGQGFKTGLHVSPHVTELRERFQINNHIINQAKYLSYLNDLLPFIERFPKNEYGNLTYFEVLVALAFYIFHKEEVDYAVIETGLGGLYDGTNVVKNTKKIAVLTKIGLDHTPVLGKTIEKITCHKAGIIMHDNQVFSIWQTKKARKVIEEASRKRSAKLTYLKKGMNYSNVKRSPIETVFDFKFDNIDLPEIHLKLAGDFQAENCSLALAVLYAISKRGDFTIDEKQLRNALKKVFVPARLEIIDIEGKTIIIDGAHNPQKMKALTKNLISLYPVKKFNFLVAFKRGKDYKNMLKMIIPLANRITVTCFNITDQDAINLSEDTDNIRRCLLKNNFHRYEIISDTGEALKTILNGKKLLTVITGSFYLIGNIYPQLHNTI